MAKEQHLLWGTSSQVRCYRQIYFCVFKHSLSPSHPFLIGRLVSYWLVSLSIIAGSGSSVCLEVVVPVMDFHTSVDIYILKKLSKTKRVDQTEIWAFHHNNAKMCSPQALNLCLCITWTPNFTKVYMEH